MHEGSTTIRSLWFKLSVVFSLLTMLSVVVILHIPGIIFERDDFDKLVVPENVERQVRTMQLPLAEAVKKRSQKWLAVADTELQAKLVEMTSVEDNFYIGLCSYRKLYYRVLDLNDGVFASSPEQFPLLIAEIFANRSGADWETAGWAREGCIWVGLPLVDEAGERQGRVEIVFEAEYAITPMLEYFAKSYLSDWYYVLFFFSITGLACGIVANRFVTGRLNAMHTATSAWCKGDLSPRIPVDEKSHDILAVHSRSLNIMADELQSLLDLRYSTAVREERTRVARELHDTVKQNLFALRLQLTAIKQNNRDEEIAAPIEEARQIIHEAQHDITGILAQLNSSIPDDIGFYERLSALSENMRKRHQLETAWARKEAVSLSSGEKQTLIRIAQEAMANAAHHGRATKMVMDFYRQGNFMNWTLTDNGCGLEKNASRRHGSGLGLGFMRDRARDLPDGEFSIDDARAGGTVVAIKWRAI